MNVVVAIKKWLFYFYTILSGLIIMNIPERYIPKTLKREDREKQIKNIRKSRKLYQQGKYIVRPHLDSFHSRPSSHVERAKKMYHVNSIKASKKLSKKSGCSLSALRKILNKGRGAYYSGSRPNQTPESWARARLASALTGGPASKIDYSILKEGCKADSKALSLAQVP
jgi:hypothetical protein